MTLRSKDNGGRLVAFDAGVEVIDQVEAADAVAALAKERLNAPDGARLVERWAAGSQVIRLTPREPVP